MQVRIQPIQVFARPIGDLLKVVDAMFVEQLLDLRPDTPDEFQIIRLAAAGL